MSPERPPATVMTWAGRPGAAEVLDGARRLMEAGKTGDRTCVSADLSAEQRGDVGRVLGMQWELSTKPVTLGRLRVALESLGTTLMEVLVATGGGLRDLPAEKAAAKALKIAGQKQVHDVLIRAGLPSAVTDLALSPPRRWLGSGAVAAVTAEQFAVLMRTLPRGSIMLAALADELYGDPHALDHKTVLGRAATRILAALDALDQTGAQLESGSRLNSEAPGEVNHLVAAAEEAMSPAGRHAAWARFGVTCDSLSSTVLALNVPLPGISAAASVLLAGSETGEPVWLTARALTAIETPHSESLAGVVIRVCENPSVVEAAADRYGAGCVPLVCTYGRPSIAAWLLLSALARAGAALLVSADRDKYGLDIASDLLSLPGARAWLPEETGYYEEGRLAALLADLKHQAADPDDHAPAQHG